MARDAQRLVGLLLSNDTGHEVRELPVGLYKLSTLTYGVKGLPFLD